MSLDLKRQQLTEISKGHRVSSLYIFGSVLTDSFDKENRSDLDFLVSFNQNTLMVIQKIMRI